MYVYYTNRPGAKGQADRESTRQGSFLGRSKGKLDIDRKRPPAVVPVLFVKILKSSEDSLPVLPRMVTCTMACYQDCMSTYMYVRRQPEFVFPFQIP